MKIPAIVPAALCVVAGILLSGDALVAYLSDSASSMGSSEKFDVFSFAVGLYFIGKGLFIHTLLDAVSGFKQH